MAFTPILNNQIIFFRKNLISICVSRPMIVGASPVVATIPFVYISKYILT